MTKYWRKPADIDNRSQMIPLLDKAPLGVAVRISRIDWTAMSQDEGRRLREFGLAEGVEVTPLHRGSLFSRDPLSLAIGRMQIVIRSAHAAAIEIEKVAA